MGRHAQASSLACAARDRAVNPFLAALIGAVPAAAIAFALHRRAASRWHADAARRAKAAARELDGLREKQARAKASLAEEIAALRAEIDRRRSESQRLVESAAAAEAERRAPRITLDPCPRAFGEWLSQRLATIVSGIEGGTFQLIESTPAMRGNSNELETLWLAIRHLRRFHDKVQAYTRIPRVDGGSTQLERLVSSLGDDLAAADFGFQISCVLPPEPTLPIDGDLEHLTTATTLVCAALRQLEHRAMRLSIGVETSFERSHPELHLELTLESDEDGEASDEPPTAGFLVGRAAAQNVLAALGGGVSFDHQPGHAARALVRLPLHVAAEEPTPPQAHAPVREASEVPTRQHRYGGVIVIEADQAIRSMLATELKAHGRSVFACPDEGAARALLQATPERFEILVVDHHARLRAGEALAATVAERCPDLRVFVLSETEAHRLPAEFAERVTAIKKPFGVQELRRALGTALLG